MSELVGRAKAFATKAHEGQVRPNKAQEPYITHPEEVARLIKESGGSEEEIASGWLHDVPEDTSSTLAEIAASFGTVVARIVEGLTDPPEFAGLPRAERKRRQAERVKGESNSVKRCKLADQISNIRGCGVDPPYKWSEEDRLDYIKGAWLVAQACRGVSDYLDAEFQKVYDRAIALYP
jgi:guanosine-3',5'-bis(diphosphate) 3'-pyrophosphohydrolase